MIDEAPSTDPFILVNQSGRREAAGIRKKIRSRAARHSHEVSRKVRKPCEDNKQDVTLSRPPSRVLTSSSSSSSSEPVTPYTQSTIVPLVALACNNSAIDEDEHDKQHEECFTATSKAVVGFKDVQGLPPSNVPPATCPKQIHNGLVYPVPEQWFFARTITFLWQWIPYAWQMLDVNDSDRKEALPWVQKLTMSSPPYFYMNMLSAATTLVSKEMLPESILPWLMTQTVRAINNALSRPDTMLEVGVILAVGRIALRECMRGAYSTGVTVHRPAHARMLAMAGGLDALAIPNLVKQHILWSERLVASKTGVALTDLHPGAMGHPQATHITEADGMVLKAYYLDDKPFTMETPG